MVELPVRCCSTERILLEVDVGIREKVTQLHVFPVSVDTSKKYVASVSCPYCSNAFRLVSDPQSVQSRSITQWAVRVLALLLFCSTIAASFFLFLYREKPERTLGNLWGPVSILAAVGLCSIVLLLQAASFGTWTLRTKIHLDYDTAHIDSNAKERASAHQATNIPFRFACCRCGKDIVVRYLKSGEIAQCRDCGTNNQVPAIADEARVMHLRGRPLEPSHVILYSEVAYAAAGSWFTPLSGGKLLRSGLVHKWVEPEKETKEVWNQVGELSRRINEQFGPS